MPTGRARSRSTAATPGRNGPGAHKDEMGPGGHGPGAVEVGDAVGGPLDSASSSSTAAVGYPTGTKAIWVSCRPRPPPRPLSRAAQGVRGAWIKGTRKQVVLFAALQAKRAGKAPKGCQIGFEATPATSPRSLAADQVTAIRRLIALMALCCDSLGNRLNGGFITAMAAHAALSRR